MSASKQISFDGVHRVLKSPIDDCLHAENRFSPAGKGKRKDFQGVGASFKAAPDTDRPRAAPWACLFASGAPRRTATTSASTASAISGAVTASMSSPTGPRMRASAASSWPSARSRASRAAWVRRLPSAPI